MLSKLTLIGLHNYTKGAIWDDMLLPSGIDVEVLTNEILRKAGEFPVLYPDPEFLQIQIKMWCKKWYHNFEKWNEVYHKSYEPLYNVDVTTVNEEHGKNHSSEQSASSGNRSGNGSGNSSGNNGSTDTKSKAAFDANTFQNTEQDVISGNTSMSSSETHSESEAHSESMSADSSHDITTTEIKRGNQGITMSQELLLAEYNAWMWNLYNQIADIFISEFCVCIYV